MVSSVKFKFSVLFYFVKMKKNKKLNLCCINLKINRFRALEKKLDDDIFFKTSEEKKIKNGMHLISFTKATTDRFWVTIVITNLSVIDILRLFNVVTSPRPTLFCKQLCSTPRSSSFSSDTIYIYLNTSTLFCSFFREI